MARQPLFAGLVFDEFDHPLEAGAIGSEPAYIINDAGFRRHIPAEQIDRFILNEMKKMIQGNEGFLSEQAAKMIGADDLIRDRLANLRGFGCLLNDDELAVGAAADQP